VEVDATKEVAVPGLAASYASDSGCCSSGGFSCSDALDLCFEFSPDPSGKWIVQGTSVESSSTSGECLYGSLCAMLSSCEHLDVADYGPNDARLLLSLLDGLPVALYERIGSLRRN
jgi:hypothetical protein